MRSMTDQPSSPPCLYIGIAEISKWVCLETGPFDHFFEKRAINTSTIQTMTFLNHWNGGALYLDNPEKYSMFQCEHCIRDPLVEGVRHFFSSGSRSRFEECFKGFLFRMNYFSDRRVHGWHPWAKCKVHSAGGIQLCSCDCSKSLPFLLSEACMFRIGELNSISLRAKNMIFIWLKHVVNCGNVR